MGCERVAAHQPVDEFQDTPPDGQVDPQDVWNSPSKKILENSRVHRHKDGALEREEQTRTDAPSTRADRPHNEVLFGWTERAYLVWADVYPLQDRPLQPIRASWQSHPQRFRRARHPLRVDAIKAVACVEGGSSPYRRSRYCL